MPPHKLSPYAWPSGMTRWLRDPLLHFLLIGGMIFAFSNAIGPRSSRQVANTQQQNLQRIELTEATIQELETAWVEQRNRPPTEEERSRIKEEAINEEILYREALALGLDRNDPVVKRRLAQKMESHIQSTLFVNLPNDDELQAWFEKHSRRFSQPGRVTFRHLFFSPELRKQQVGKAAIEALEKLAGSPAKLTSGAKLGDPSAFQEYYADRSPEQLTELFGATFARAIFQLQPGSWQGPIESGFGWHLVHVNQLTPSRVPDFKEVKHQVQLEWLTEQRAQLHRQAFEKLKARYQIILPEAPGQTSGSPIATMIKER